MQESKKTMSPKSKKGISTPDKKNNINTKLMSTTSMINFPT